MKRTFGVLSLALVLATVAFSQTSSAPQPQTETLSKKQLLSLIATAKTPAEHQRIAHYYEAKAQDYLDQSKMHQEMADQYRKNPLFSSSKLSAGTIGHCEYLAKSLKDDADKMQELAQLHERMAKDAAGR
jgi:hypothetical protein